MERSCPNSNFSVILRNNGDIKNSQKISMKKNLEKNIKCDLKKAKSVSMTSDGHHVTPHRMSSAWILFVN